MRAVEQFKLRALEGLSESVNNGIGSVIRHQEQVKNAADTALVGKYLIFLVAVEKSIALAEKARPMLGPVVRALLPGIEPLD